MPLSVAEIYLLALRKSMVPVIGEAVPHPFDEQIELDSWSWTLEPPDADDKKKKDGQQAAKPAPDKQKDAKPPSIDFERLKTQDNEVLKAIERLQKEERRNQVDRNQAVLKALRDAQEKRRNELAEGQGDDAGANADDAEGNDRYTFKFSKNVDLATTQLLNSMKAGEVFPRMAISVIHRATHAPLKLVFTFKNVTLLTYSLKSDVTDTMSDMTEDWTARFEEMDYLYQNRPGIGGVPGVTQGTARIFKMGLKKLF